MPAGPERRELVSGRPVVLPDGRTVQPQEVLGEPQKGAKLCFVGDVSRTGPLHKIVAGADLLAIEATYLEEERELAKSHGHITARAAARLALKAGVKQLVLHHISRRYHARQILEEARAVFPKTDVAGDLDLFRVRRGKPVEYQAGPKYVVRGWACCARSGQVRPGQSRFTLAATLRRVPGQERNDPPVSLSTVRMIRCLSRLTSFSFKLWSRLW